MNKPWPWPSRSNPGLKAADAQVEAADASALRSASGFLPKVNLSETWSKTDNPLMVLGTKLNQEIVGPSDFDPRVMNHPEPISNYNTRLSVMQPLVQRRQGIHRQGSGKAGARGRDQSA